MAHTQPTSPRTSTAPLMHLTVPERIAMWSPSPTTGICGPATKTTPTTTTASGAESTISTDNKLIGPTGTSGFGSRTTLQTSVYHTGDGRAATRPTTNPASSSTAGRTAQIPLSTCTTGCQTRPSSSPRGSGMTHTMA